MTFNTSEYASCANPSRDNAPYGLLQLTNINTAFALLWKYFKYQQNITGRLYTNLLYKTDGSSETGVVNKEYMCANYTKTYHQTQSTMSGSWPNTSFTLSITFYN